MASGIPVSLVQSPIHPSRDHFSRARRSDKLTRHNPPSITHRVVSSHPNRFIPPLPLHSNCKRADHVYLPTTLHSFDLHYIPDHLITLPISSVNPD